MQSLKHPDRSPHECSCLGRPPRWTERTITHASQTHKRTQTRTVLARHNKAWHKTWT